MCHLISTLIVNQFIVRLLILNRFYKELNLDVFPCFINNFSNVTLAQLD